MSAATCTALNDLMADIWADYGFISPANLRRLVAFDRLRPVLVRCGACRFTAPAQDVETLARYVEAGGDYVRDYSLPATGGGR